MGSSRLREAAHAVSDGPTEPAKPGMAGYVWDSFASGTMKAWEKGIVSLASDRAPDHPFMPEFPGFFMQDGLPDWMADLIRWLDEAVPAPATIQRALDPDCFVLDSRSPAFRMPMSPSPRDAGRCLAAARVLLACREDVIPPAFVPEHVALHWVEQASWLALMLGGEEAFLVAITEMKDPESFRAAPMAAGGPDEIEFGETEE